MLFLLTQVCCDGSCESNPLGRAGVGGADHKEGHDGDRPCAEEQGEVEEEGEDLAGGGVGHDVHGDDVADTESKDGDTEVDQEHTSLCGTLTGEGERKGKIIFLSKSIESSTIERLPPNLNT